MLLILRCHLGLSLRTTNYLNSTEKMFWAMLCVDEKYLATVLWVNPRWDRIRNVLQVSRALEALVDWFGLIRVVVIYFMRWIHFSETRWGVVGGSGRRWASSELVGIGYLAKYVVDSDATAFHNKHFVGGYLRSDFAARKYLAISMILVFPCEAFVLMMFKDDRFPSTKRVASSGG